MSTGFRKSSRSPRRGSLKMSFRESWSMPSTPSVLRISSAPSSRRPFGKASVSRSFTQSAPRASGSPRDESRYTGQVGARLDFREILGAQERRRGTRLVVAGRLADEHAGRARGAARVAGDPPDQRKAVDAAVEREARLVALHLREKLGHEPGRQVRWIAHDEIGAETADTVEQVRDGHADTRSEAEGAR